MVEQADFSEDDASFELGERLLEIKRIAKQFQKENKAQNKADNVSFGNVGWMIGDVQSIAKLNKKDAFDWLNKNERHIRDRMTELGWDVLRNLLQYDNVKMKD